MKDLEGSAILTFLQDKGAAAARRPFDLYGTSTAVYTVGIRSSKNLEVEIVRYDSFEPLMSVTRRKCMPGAKLIDQC